MGVRAQRCRRCQIECSEAHQRAEMPNADRRAVALPAGIAISTNASSVPHLSHSNCLMHALVHSTSLQAALRLTKVFVVAPQPRRAPAIGTRATDCSLWLKVGANLRPAPER